MSCYLAIITGMGGDECYLAPGGCETASAKCARHFRSADAAEAAASAHVESFPPAVQRGVSYRVEPLARESA